MEIFANLDACVTPVLSLDEAHHHPHHQSRRSFRMRETSNDQSEEACFEPCPSPRPINADSGLVGLGANLDQKAVLHHGQHTKQVLKELGYSNEEFNSLIEDGIVISDSWSAFSLW